MIKVTEPKSATYNVADLHGDMLDLAVAKALDWQIDGRLLYLTDEDFLIVEPSIKTTDAAERFEPSAEFAHAVLVLGKAPAEHLDAAMRRFVVSRLGNVVEIP